LRRSPPIAARIAQLNRLCQLGLVAQIFERPAQRLFHPRDLGCRFCSSCWSQVGLTIVAFGALLLEGYMASEQLQ
jgi:hypothetical protein